MKRKYLWIYISYMACMVFAPPSYAGNVQNGKTLHDNNCTNCHASLMGGEANTIYTREDRRLSNYAGLISQVNRCKTSLGVAWPAEQIDDVVTYLNEQFYKFKK